VQAGPSKTKGLAADGTDGPRRLSVWLSWNQPTPIPPPPPLLAFFGEFKNAIRGVQKRHKHVFAKKSMSKTFPKKIDKNFDVRFSSIFLFCLVFGCFLATEIRKHYKKRFTKKSCRKAFTKKSTKNPKPIFSRLVYHVLGCFSIGEGEGSSKTPQKISKINLTLDQGLVLFWPLTHPPTTGSPSP
jgi:hypothetical protein